MSNDLIKLRKTEGGGIGGGGGGTGSGNITLPATPYVPGGWVLTDSGLVNGDFVVYPPGTPPDFNWPGAS